MIPDMPDPAPFVFTYRNWRGEIGERRAIPIWVWFGSTEWHPEPQWLLRAYDCDKRETRDFAMRDIGAMQAAMPAPAGVRVKAPTEEQAARAICEARGLNPDCQHQGVPESGEPDGYWPQRDPFINAEKEVPWYYGWRIHLPAARAVLSLSAIEDAGAREGAEPLTMPVAHDPRFPSSGGTTKTIDGTLYNASTPAGAGDLVERLRAYPNLRQTAGKLMQEAANALVDLKAQIDDPKAEQDDPRYHSDHLDDNLGVPDDAGQCAAQRIRRDAAKISAAEAERDALHAGLSALVHCQSALTRAQMREAAASILDRAGLDPKWLGGDQSPFVLRATTAEADLAALRAEVERKDRALRDLVALNNDHSPFGGEMYQDRVDRAWSQARAALAPAKAGG